MLSISDGSVRMCDGLRRREAIRVGGLSALGLSLPQLLSERTAGAVDQPNTGTSHLPSFGKAKSVILFWLLGGPPQHESWDPKPDAPENIRGEFGAIDSIVPGIRVGELMPLTSRHTDKLAVLRAVVTKDQAHSSSGYQMLTGVPHEPLSSENVTAKAPNLWPSWGAIVRALRPDRNGLPSAITLPRHIANDGEIVWPGQDAGFLGRKFDPWLLNCDPSEADFRIPEISLAPGIDDTRLNVRRDLLRELDHRQQHLETSLRIRRYTQQTQQAFTLVTGKGARDAFSVSAESEHVRDRYGRNRFGQSVLMSRRLVEAGASLVQVNWTRVAGADNNGTWDTHKNHCASLKNPLMPMMDQTFSALLEDLDQRGMLDETLVAWLGEFGHTPKINGNAGRDHWGNCFSLALAGGGIKGGVVHGESDAHAAYPVSGIVTPRDIAATIFHCLGYVPETQIHDQFARPIQISRGEVIEAVL
ncbi:MAG: DUF1501 domain-containing protein [Planctomycetaceae bacterium]